MTCARLLIDKKLQPEREAFDFNKKGGLLIVKSMCGSINFHHPIKAENFNGRMWKTKYLRA
jgi:hypothetical protein